MRILILHNAYRQPGGEDSVVRNESEALRATGHDVVIETVSNESITTVGDKLNSLLRVGHDSRRIGWMQQVIERVRPDVLHVHNFFPLLTIAVHEAAHAMGVPVVQTLHNYRLGCANATFMREGAVCESCLGGSRLPALLHRCYRDSLPGTTALLSMQRAALMDGAMARNVDRFIALTQFARDKFVEIGLPPEKLVIKPNFVNSPDAPDPAAPREGALFVGRLAPEKGVAELVQEWTGLSDIPLKIAGDGVLLEELRGKAGPNVQFLGHLDSQRIQQEMRKARALVFPSTWYEGFPVTLVEGFANGLPAIVRKLGSMAEIVEHGVNGFHFGPVGKTALQDAVRQFFGNPEMAKEMSLAARLTYENRYTLSRNVNQLESIYREAVAIRGPA